MEPIVPLHPLEDRLVIRLNEAETITEFGLHLPDNAQQTPNIGKVLAAGPGRYDQRGVRVPLAVAVGDEVVVPKYGGTNVTVDGIEYLLILESDVLAVIEPELVAVDA